MREKECEGWKGKIKKGLSLSCHGKDEQLPDFYRHLDQGGNYL